ncbi:hypothetical protein JCM3775_001706 [Rhodotorula graminis]
MDTKPPTRRVTVFSAHVDPATASTHTLPIRLAFSPFNSGDWRITYAPPPTKNGRFEPAAVKLRWDRVDVEPDLCNARLAVEADGEVHSVEMPLASQRACEWIVLVGRPTTRLRVVLEVDKPHEEPAAVDRVMAMIDQPQVIDVCLTFPGDRRTLFASSALLATASPWWAECLSARGFREETMSMAHTPAEPGWPDSDCSDDDDDDEVSSRGRRTPALGRKVVADLAQLSIPASPPPSPPTRSRPLIPPHMRVVPIVGTAYRTYRAYLAWLYTGTVAFAPLSSSFQYPSSPPSSSSSLPSRTSPSSASTQRRAALAPLRTLHPSRPHPVSPKSLYRLAHFLDTPSLAAQCLAALTDALTVDNVAHELLAPPAMGEVYDDVWNVEAGFAEEAWDDVRGSEAMRDAAERMKGEGGAGPHELATLLRLSGIKT